MRDSGRRPGSGDTPTPPPNDNGREPADRATPNPDQTGGPARERSWIRATRPAPHKAPPRWAKPTPDNSPGPPPGEHPAPNTGNDRTRQRPRARPAPRDDRTPTDTAPDRTRTEAPSSAAPTEARSAEITGLRERAATDRDNLTRRQTDDTSPGTADASGPGAPDDPGPPAPPDHPDDPERDKPEEPTALDAANAEIADLRKQLADSKTELDTAKTEIGELKDQIETVTAEAEAKIETVKAEADAKLDAATAIFDAKLESAQEANDAKMAALEARFAATIDGLHAKDERPEHTGPEARANGIDRDTEVDQTQPGDGPGNVEAREGHDKSGPDGSRVDNPRFSGEAFDDQAKKPERPRRSLLEPSIMYGLSGVEGGLTTASTLMHSNLGVALGISSTVLTFGVGTYTYARNLVKEWKNRHAD